jgi:hypothetical protein
MLASGLGPLINSVLSRAQNYGGVRVLGRINLLVLS